MASELMDVYKIVELEKECNELISILTTIIKKLKAKRVL